MLDKILGIVSAATAPILTLLIDTHNITATVATDIGGIIFALIAGWHGNAIVTQRKQNAGYSTQSKISSAPTSAAGTGSTDSAAASVPTS